MEVSFGLYLDLLEERRAAYERGFRLGVEMAATKHVCKELLYQEYQSLAKEGLSEAEIATKMDEKLPAIRARIIEIDNL